MAVKLVPLFMEAHNMKLSVNSSVSELSLTIATLSLMWLYYKAVPVLQIIYKITKKKMIFSSLLLVRLRTNSKGRTGGNILEQLASFTFLLSLSPPPVLFLCLEKLLGLN